MSFTRPFLLGPVFFRTALPWSGGYHIERGGRPLHDVVVINCEKGATTGNHGSAVKYMGLGVYLDDCVLVLSDLTWLPLLGVGRKSWYIIIINIVTLWYFSWEIRMYSNNYQNLNSAGNRCNCIHTYARMLTFCGSAIIYYIIINSAYAFIKSTNMIYRNCVYWGAVYNVNQICQWCILHHWHIWLIL